MNFNHLPGGRPDGGQFTYADVGGMVMPMNVVSNPEHIATPTADIPGETLGAMLGELEKRDITQDELAKLTSERYPTPPRDFNEIIDRLNETIRDSYYKEVIAGRVATSAAVAIDRHQEAVANGGLIKVLANDDGSFQIIHGTNNSVSSYLDSLTEMREGEAAVYNPKTGTLRTDARIVPIPGTAQKIGASRTPQSKRNGLNRVATDADRRGKKASKIINRRISDSTTKEGRQLGSGEYAGRIGVCVCQNDDGDLVVQNCIICEANEGAIAEMYSKVLGGEVLKATRPAPEVINSEPGDTSILHEGGMYISKSDFGGTAGGTARDKTTRDKRGNVTSVSQVSPEAAQHMFDRHDQIRKQREEEYEKAHGGKKKPEKTEAKRQHESLLRKMRAMRRRRAEASILDEDGPIRLKGGGYVFPGETVTRRGQTLTYDEIKDGATFADGIGNKAANAQGKVASEESVASEKRRQNTKIGNRNRKQQQRAREEAIRKANAQGKGAVTYREGKDKASGKTILVIEGEPGYAEALGYKTAKAFPA